LAVMSDTRPNEHPSPARVLENLLEGNRRFTTGLRLERDLPGEVLANAAGQRPPAAIVGCIDSRATPELVFDLGIGEAFDIRLAGAIVDDIALGSLEYACSAAGAVLVLVLGHTGCGAVKAACDVASGDFPSEHGMSNLQAVIEPILEAVDAESEIVGNRSSTNEAFVDRVAELNVHRTIMEIRGRSDLLDRMIEEGRVGIAGAMYDVRTGQIRVIDFP